MCSHWRPQLIDRTNATIKDNGTGLWQTVCFTTTRLGSDKNEHADRQFSLISTYGASSGTWPLSRPGTHATRSGPRTYSVDALPTSVLRQKHSHNRRAFTYHTFPSYRLPPIKATLTLTFTKLHRSKHSPMHNAHILETTAAEQKADKRRSNINVFH